MKLLRFTRFAQRFALGFAVLCANLAFAEESGVFLGANVGYGVATMRTDFRFTEDNGDITAYKGNLTNGGGVNYGALIVGYKQFFTPHLGLRYYLNLNALHTIANPTALMARHAGISTKQKITLLNYGANVDFLGNFIANNAIDFGAFVGVGIGGDLLLGADLDNYLQGFLANIGANLTTDLKLRKNNLNVWLNVGLRTNLAKYHSVEIFARISALSNNLLDERLNAHGAEWSVKTTITNRYNIGIRYGFSF